MVPGGKPGIGIGLASVRMIADLHMGKAWWNPPRRKGVSSRSCFPGVAVAWIKDEEAEKK
jgi:hypothetical protein